MVVLIWIVLGWVAGVLASKLFHRTARASALDVTLGIVGAIAGGLAFNSLGFPQVTATVVAGSLGAAAGSVVLLAGYRAIFRRA
jgi:uncharacterized membrane protein YeaQ/YmgE (transglycosylase-associated protein family)